MVMIGEEFIAALTENGDGVMYCSPGFNVEKNENSNKINIYIPN